MKLVAWIAAGLATLVALGLGAFLLLQRPIGEAMFRRAVADNMGRDRAAELPDGLHVFLCGSGSPMPDPTRAGPCVGVVAGGRSFVFDVGSGSARRLARMGFPVGRLDGVYLTHLHSDHFDGLGELLLQAWVGGPRHAPLLVSGPTGVSEVVAGFNAAYRIDSGFRTRHHGPAIADPAGYGGAANELVLPPGPTGKLKVFDEDGVSITAFLVNHAPVEPAFGYRIDYKGRAVVISGDTVRNANLVAVASGADVLMHEALNPDMVMEMSRAAGKRGQANIAKILSDIRSYHSTPSDAAQSAQEAHVRLLVLDHIVPPLPSGLLDAAFLGEAGKLFAGQLLVGQDGLLVSLPAGGKRIDTTVLN